MYQQGIVISMQYKCVCCFFDRFRKHIAKVDSLASLADFKGDDRLFLGDF